MEASNFTKPQAVYFVVLVLPIFEYRYFYERYFIVDVEA